MARRKPKVIDDPNDAPLNKEAREEFEKVWAPFVCDSRGRLKRNHVMRELLDYGIVQTEVSKVYMEITNGKLSKPGYEASVVIGVANDENNEVWAQTLADEKAEWELKRAAELLDLKNEVEHLQVRVNILQDSASGQVASVEEVCFVDLKNGPTRENRIVKVTTSKGKYRALWNTTYDVIVVGGDNPLPDEWIDTVLEAVHALDKKES